MSNNTNTNVGNNNSVLGSWALSSAINDTSCNSAFGTNSLLKHTTGSFNTSIGAGAMTFNITGNRNVAVGSSALEQNAKSENNTAIGTQALFGQRDGSNNTAIGINAGLNDVSGSFNTYLGANTGPDSSLNTWTKSTAIGSNAKVDVSNQIVLGTSGEFVCIPSNKGLSIGKTTAPNYALDISGSISVSGDYKSDGNFNTKIGTSSLNSNTGQKNTAIGYKSLSGNISGNNNTAIGYQSLTTNYSASANNNTAIGCQTLQANIDGSSNTAIGFLSLGSNVSGIYNTAIGGQSLASNRGGYNTAVGCYSLFSNTDSSNNTAIGYNLAGGKDMSGNNTFVGAYADISSNITATNIRNSMALGYNAKVDASNQIVLGNSSITQLKCQVPTITSLSDRRDKKDIEELDTGIDFIEKVKPVKFNWNMRDGGKVDVPEWGFIAQDLIEIGGKQVPNLIDDSNEDKYCIGQMAMFPVLVKAVQDLKKIVDAQAKEIAELKSTYQPLESTFEKG